MSSILDYTGVTLFDVVTLTQTYKWESLRRQDSEVEIVTRSTVLVILTSYIIKQFSNWVTIWLHNSDMASHAMLPSTLSLIQTPCICWLI